MLKGAGRGLGEGPATKSGADPSAAELRERRSYGLNGLASRTPQNHTTPVRKDVKSLSCRV